MLWNWCSNIVFLSGSYNDCFFVISFHCGLWGGKCCGKVEDLRCWEWEKTCRFLPSLLLVWGLWMEGGESLVGTASQGCQSEMVPLTACAALHGKLCMIKCNGWGHRYISLVHVNHSGKTGILAMTSTLRNF